MFLSYKYREFPVVGILLLINIFYFFILELNGGSKNWLTLVYYGAKEGISISRGEYWRLFTPIFMHIGFFHLIVNSIGLIVFGPIMEKIFGPLRFTIIYILSGVWGNIFSFISSVSVGAGASGALFGLAGCYAAYLYINKDDLGKFGRESLVGLSWIVGINIVFGFTVSGIDNSAHLGGLFSGFIFGYLLAPRILTTFVSQFESMEINIEKRVSVQRPLILWVAFVITNIIINFLVVRITINAFY